MRDYFLTSARCGFSRWRAEDLPLARALWGQPAVTRYICVSGVFTPEDIANRLETELALDARWGVQYFPFFLPESGEFVGCCGLRPYGEQDGVYELGFHLREEFWRRGLAVEAATAMIDYAFTVLGATELKAGHNPDNVGSRAVLGKLGFVYERDEFYPPTGRYHPLYSMKR